jgi:hypothetical protein
MPPSYRQANSSCCTVKAGEVNGYVRGTPDAYAAVIKLCDEKEQALEFFARHREWFSRRLEGIEQNHGPMLVFDPEMIERAICDDIPPLWPDS